MEEPISENIADGTSGKESDDESQIVESEDDDIEGIVSEVVDEQCHSDGDIDNSPSYRRDLEKDYGVQDGRQNPNTPLGTPLIRNTSEARPPMTTCAKRQRIKDALADFMRSNQLGGSDSQRQPQKRRKQGDSTKFIKPDPFPTGVPHEARWSTWLDWKVQFDAALAVSGSLSQNQMANHLFLSVGAELRQIINAYALKPDPSQVSEDFPFYDKLLEGLDKYFEGSSDATVDIKNLMEMSQKESESVRDFHVRLMLQARVCFKRNFSSSEYSTLLRDRLVGGLRDREVANMAFLNEWDVEKVVEVASRSETLKLNRKMVAETAPLAEVFEVRSNDAPSDNRRDRRAQEFPVSHAFTTASKRLNRPSTSRSDNSRGSGPCKNCGLKLHRPSGCPAIGKDCRRCKKIGHFAIVCNREVNEIVSEAKQESNEEKVIYD